MRRRLISSLVIAICVFAFLSESYAKKSKAQLFFEPSRKMVFKIPHGWMATQGFGNRVANLTNDSHGRIYVISNPVSDVKRLIAELHSGASIDDAAKRRVSNRDALITFFDFHSDEHIKGAAIEINDGDCNVDIVCTDVHKDFAPTFLSSRELASDIRCDVRPDPDQWNEVFKRAMARGAFAYLDGRAGCAGVGEEPRRMAMIARELGKRSDADELESMALKLSTGAETDKALPFHIPKHISKFFSSLMRSQVALENGNTDKAKRMISDVESYDQLNSRLLTAIKIKIACREKDLASAEKWFEGLKDDVCGRSGAMAAYELGTAIETSDQGRAIKLFEQAIDADKAFIPAYVSLGRALIKSGLPASLASARMQTLLSQAPAVPRVKDFRKRLERSAGP